MLWLLTVCLSPWLGIIFLTDPLEQVSHFFLYAYPAEAQKRIKFTYIPIKKDSMHEAYRLNRSRFLSRYKYDWVTYHVIIPSPNHILYFNLWHSQFIFYAYATVSHHNLTWVNYSALWFTSPCFAKICLSGL